MIKSIKTKLKFMALATLVVTLLGCIVMAFTGLGFVTPPKTASADAVQNDGAAEQSSEDLVAAWNSAVESGGTFTLTEDWIAASPSSGFGTGDNFYLGGLYVPAGKSVTLDLNGHTLDRNSLRKAFDYDSDNGSSVIEVRGKLTIQDSAIGGTITGGYGNYDSAGVLYGGGVRLMDGAELILNGGTITGNGEILRGYILSGGGVSVGNRSRFEMNGGKISGNLASTGGALCVNSGAMFAMNGGTITDNTADDGFIDGVLVWDNSTLAINGGDTGLMGCHKGSPYNKNVYYVAGISSWMSIVELSLANPESQVVALLRSQWTANSTHSFGTGTGFSEGRIYIPAGANILLDLNGYTINRGLTSMIENGNVFYVKGALEITDTSISKDGKITGGNTNFRGGGIWVYDKGSLTLSGGTITGNTAGLAGGVYCADGTFIMNGGAISDNTALYEGGGAYCLKSTFIMNDGKITGNSGSYGGALHLNADTVIINGGEISGNVSTVSGGGISMNGSTAFTMTGGKIFGNTASAGGGGIYATTNSVLEITGGVIGGSTEAEGNTAQQEGGGVYLIASTLIMNGGAINGNTASDGGGGISSSGCTIELNAGTISNNSGPNGGGIRLYGTMTMTGGTISGNAAGSGGGICLGSTSHLQIYGGEISDNTATNNGGGITLFNDNTFTMYGGTISGNTANSIGGGVFVNALTQTRPTMFYMYGGTISGNTAKGSGGGGGVNVNEYGSFIITDGVISGNTTPNSGGAGVCVHSEGSFTMEGGTISDNEAHGYGGALHIYPNAKVVMNGGTITGNTAMSGGGCAYNSGTFIMNGGTITGNTATGGAGGGVDNRSTFTLNGGTISGNTASNVGGGVYIDVGTFEMSGGTISGNTASKVGGGGVYICEDTTFNLSGGIIVNNKNASGEQNNVYLEWVTINITGAFAVAGKNATRVGITNSSLSIFTSGYSSSGNSVSNINRFFFSDQNYALSSSSGEVTLLSSTTSAKTTITWGYRSSGSAIPVDGNYYSVEYTGASYSIELSTGSIQYAVDENGAPVSSVSKVGKYYFTVANPENYTNPTFTFEILPQNIAGAEISVVSSYIYNGNAITPELSVTLGGKRLTEGVDFTASYSNNVNAGTAKILIVGKGDYKGMAEGAFTIAKRNLNIRWGNTEAEYNGSVKSITAVVEGLLNGETVKLTLAYEQDGKTVYPVNAGEYLVMATIASDNYVLAPNADVTCKFTIKPRYISVVWSGANFVYNGEAQQPEAHYVNANGTTVNLNVAVDGSPVTVGEYTATATAARVNANYVLANTTYKYNIIKATAEIEWSDGAFAFDGEGKTPTATVTGIGGEDLSASVSLAYYKDGKLLDGAPVNVGNYVVKATLAHNDYELEAECKFVISAAQMTVNSEYTDTVFTGEGKTPEITATFNGEELEIKVTYAVKGSSVYSEELPVNVGEYIAKITEVNGNFVDKTVSFEITKATVAIVWSLDELSVKVVSSTKTTYQWLYDGKAHAPVATATFNGVALELNVDGITELGTYTVTAALKDTRFNSNFNITNTTANVEIVRTAITDVRWYENGATEPLASGEKPSYKYIEVYGATGPKLSAYGAANLTGLNDTGESITVTVLIPLDVSYPEFVRNGFWAAREEAYGATASLSSAFAPYCDMKTTETSVEFYVTGLTVDESSADVRWVVEVGGKFIDVSEYEFIYNGAVQSPKAIVVLDADKFAADPTDLTSFAYLPVGGAMTDAGTYYAYILPCKYLIAEDNAECLFTIKPLDVTVTWQVGEYTYNGTAQAPAARVSGTGGLACKVSVAGFVNAGNHVAIAVVDKNFNIVEGATQEFTIGKLNLAADRVEWDCDESGAKREDDFFVWNYDGELHLPTATMKIRINGETVDVSLAVTGSASSVGTHYAFAILSNTDKNNSNYAFAGARARFDIVLDTISHIYWSDEDADGNICYTYDGKPHLPTAYYMNGSTRVDLTVIGERTEAGKYVAYVTDNFDFAVSTRHEFTILPQSLNVVWSRVEVIYTGSEQRPVVRFTDEDGVTVYLEAEEYSVTGFIGAGEYTAEIFSLNGNYTFVNATSEYTIKAVEITLTWLGNDDGTFVWEYDGEKHVPTVSHGINGVTVEVIGGESGVGVYTAVAVCDNENYVITNATQEYEIKPFEITVTWTVGDYTYDGESYFAPTASYVDWNGDEHALTVNGARTDAGEYTAEAVLPENCAFKFESGENAGTHKFEIKRLLLTEISWTGNEDGTFVWEFDGEAHCPVATAGTVKIAITGGAVNAGEYVATAEPANYQNYAFAEGVEVEKTFKITPKTVDVNGTAKTAEKTMISSGSTTARSAYLPLSSRTWTGT